MRSVKFKVVFFSALLLLPALPGGLAVEKPWTEQFLKEFTQIKNRLAEFEKAQEVLLQREDEALKEIDRIRKWAAHRPGKPHP